MLYTKTAPVGIDIPIQKLQTYLHDKLLEVWNIATGQYQCYGRCYRNQKDDGYVAEVYRGNKEYQEVYMDDRYSAISFFGISGQTEVQVINTAEVHLIFWVNISKLKTVNHRGDEEVRKDVQVLIQNGLYSFNLTGIKLGIENVLKEYEGSIEAAKQVKFRDMHPFHCFRFDFSLPYNIKQC